MYNKEYGGYLPLELNSRGYYHSYDNSKMIKCNSGLTSIYCALRIALPKIIYLPHFICESVKQLVNSMGIKTKYYNIDKFLSPTNVSLKDNEYILWVNYFGVCDEKIDRIVSRYDRLIIDNTQSFFTEPVFKSNVFNVYSCRKFVGVPDGGYLISNSINNIELEKDYSSERSLFLLKQIEHGINAAYKDSLINYDLIMNERRNMSELTSKILNSIDYIAVKRKRKDNFLWLHSFLKDYNLFPFFSIDSCNPYSYPLLLNVDIRKELISRKIYVPTLWREYINDDFKDKVECIYSKNICHLPIDQRYDKADMEYIAKTVLDILEER